VNDRTIVEEIKRKVTIKSVIDKFGGAELHGDGDKLTGWHKAHESESKRSLHVDNAKGVWHCKSCGLGGDVFSWVGHLRRNGSYRDDDGAMFGEAMREVAAFAGVELPEYDAEKAAERKSLEDVWQLAANFYHGELTPEHREYFHKRGYTDETIDKYKLGYAPVGPRTLLAELVRVHKIDGAELAKSGLFLKRDNGNLEDHFQGRLMFPYWRNGRVAYFIGRITDESPAWEHGRKMKYKKLLVHNNEQPYVSEQVSNRFFYGEDSVKPGGDLLITEGVADCLSALQAGFACVSPVTIRFAKKDHAKILEIAERAGTVYICNDNEVSNAGGEGTLATAQMLWEHGKVAKLITLPRPAGVSKIDLNDYLIANSPDEFKNLLPTAKTLLDLKIDQIADCTDDKAVMLLQKEAIALIAHIKDEYQLELWRESMPEKLKLGKKAYNKFLKVAVGEIEAEQAAQRKKAAEAAPKPLYRAGTKATWRSGANGDNDNPIVITGILGQTDGVFYYSIHGTTTGVPENQIVDAVGPVGAARHNYEVIDGTLCIVTPAEDENEDGTISPIATFNAWISAEHVTELGQVIYSVEGVAVRGGTFCTEVDAETFGQAGKLKIALETAVGPLDTVHAKMEPHLGPAIKLLSPSPVPRSIQFDRTGWRGERFMMPGRMPDGEICLLPSKLPYESIEADDIEGATAALSLLMQSLPDTYSPVLLGAILGAPMARLAHMQDRRYGVFIKGQTGTYKTTIAQSFMSIFGRDFLSDSNIIAWGSKATPNAIMRYATSAHDMPLLIDNYKSNTGNGARDFINVIHAIMEGGEKDRLKRNSEIATSRDISCWPFCTGEDVPDTDPATTSRLLIIPTQKTTPPAISGSPAMQRKLAQIGRIWLDWLETPEARAAAHNIAEKVAGIQSKWAAVLLAANSGMPNPYRVASTLALNQSFFAVAAQHPVLGAVLKPYVAKHAEGLQAIAHRMAAATAEGLEAQRFVATIKELLGTGRCVLYQNAAHFQKMPQVDRDRVIGWADGNGGAYLYPDLARSAVERIAGVALSGMSSNGIYNQLDDLGWVNKGRDGKTTVLKKFCNTSGRFLYLNATALDLPTVLPTGTPEDGKGNTSNTG